LCQIRNRRWSTGSTLSNREIQRRIGNHRDFIGYSTLTCEYRRHRARRPRWRGRCDWRRRIDKVCVRRCTGRGVPGQGEPARTHVHGGHGERYHARRGRHPRRSGFNRKTVRVVQRGAIHVEVVYLSIVEILKEWVRTAGTDKSTQVVVRIILDSGLSICAVRRTGIVHVKVPNFAAGGVLGANDAVG